ncbi:MAG: glucuronide permease, partial [Clostridiaceae bacterium]|nr:glucuronide permease [Clostridiaceae bacterium]
SSLTTTFVSLMYAVVGFAVVQPTENTPLSDGLLWVTLIAYCGMPIIGFLFNVVAMKFYPLTKEKMIEVQAGIADIKAKHAANMADTAVASEMANEQSKLP